MPERDNLPVHGGWIEFQLAGPPFALELFAEFMDERGAQGAVFSESPSAPGREMVTAFLARDRVAPTTIEEIKKRCDALRSEVPGEWGELRIAEVADQDWARLWKEGLDPVRLEPGIWIVPSFKPVPAAAGDEPVIVLDPGLAFGTGAHATTRASMKLMARELTAGAKSVLDLGTGSGILAMAAVKLGAERVVAVDLDPLALRTAAENFERNGLADRIQLLKGVADPESDLPGPAFSLIAANLFAESLARLMPFIARHLEPRGKAVLSGILLDRAGPVEAALNDNSLVVKKRIEEEGWLSLSAQKDGGGS